jgi:glycosyltransferase involved in cell wall biosynthesis
MDNTKLVSVIITCYNHSQYLNQAINSVRYQTYKNIEIIVVDDGSTDATKSVAQQNADVNYIYQHNQGLSAARNTGIKHSKGEFLMFLDADDFFYENAISINLEHIVSDEKLVFVSGSHNVVYTITGKIRPVVKTVNDLHYSQLLKGNYIGMHASVMYRRWVFNEFLFDTSLKACEDYDIYFKITSKYPVLNHAHVVAAYCMHQTNMSGNIPLMLESAITVLKRQQKKLYSDAEIMAYQEGLKNWKSYYIQELEKKLLTTQSFSSNEYLTLLKYDSNLTPGKALKVCAIMLVINMLNCIPSSSLKEKIRAFGSKFNAQLPALGEVNFGDLNRLTPIGSPFCSDRGIPIDQFYVDNFIGDQILSIKGRTLEIGDDLYIQRYGRNEVTEGIVVDFNFADFDNDLEETNNNNPVLLNDWFDCIILPQKLHLIYNYEKVLHTCFRILKPGGTLLLTVPGITPINHKYKDTWYWSFTDVSIKKIFQETFPESHIDVYAFGNILTATACLYGIGQEEIPLDKLLYVDSQYQVVITVKATKGKS